MSVRTIKFVDGEYYHLYNRGNSKMEIFHDKDDYDYFINLLFIMNDRLRVKTGFKNKTETGNVLISIGAYCCMPNHFHILIKQETEKGISIFMHKLLTAYVTHYNKKYKRTGSLFEGKFKSKYANEDTYLKYLFSYIHLNPLKILDKDWRLKVRSSTQEMYNFLTNYQYSSFHEYHGDYQKVVSKKSFPDYFPNKSSFVKEIFSWISLSV